MERVIWCRRVFTVLVRGSADRKCLTDVHRPLPKLIHQRNAAPREGLRRAELVALEMITHAVNAHDVLAELDELQGPCSVNTSVRAIGCRTGRYACVRHLVTLSRRECDAVAPHL